MAMVALDEPMRRLGGGLLLPVHDGLLYEVPEASAAEAEQLVKTAMTDAMSRFPRKVPVVVDTRVATNWAKE